MDKVHYSSDKMDWATPWELFRQLDAEFKFNVDVCATLENRKCMQFVSPEQDALTVAWANLRGPCWMNPPYGRELKRWVQKAYDEKANGVTTVCLVPSRTDTRWWSIFWDHERHHTRCPHDEVRFIKGRIRFEVAHPDEQGNPTQRLNPAPFPSAIVVLRGIK